jgi:hypothetical protein
LAVITPESLLLELLLPELLELPDSAVAPVNAAIGFRIPAVAIFSSCKFPSLVLSRGLKLISSHH